MSRYYGMDVLIHGVQPGRIPAVKEAAEKEWEFDGWTQEEQKGQTNLAAYGESSLCGGETEEELTDRLTQAIWRANQRFCRVTVHAIYLESLPFETHERDEEDYQKFNERSILP